MGIFNSNLQNPANGQAGSGSSSQQQQDMYNRQVMANAYQGYNSATGTQGPLLGRPIAQTSQNAPQLPGAPPGLSQTPQNLQATPQQLPQVRPGQQDPIPPTANGVGGGPSQQNQISPELHQVREAMSHFISTPQGQKVVQDFAPMFQNKLDGLQLSQNSQAGGDMGDYAQQQAMQSWVNSRAAGAQQQAGQQQSQQSMGQQMAQQQAMRQMQAQQQQAQQGQQQQQAQQAQQQMSQQMQQQQQQQVQQQMYQQQQVQMQQQAQAQQRAQIQQQSYAMPNAQGSATPAWVNPAAGG